jgi:hypothetical protein
MERTCKVCGESKNDTDFYARVWSRCRDCHKMLVRKNRAEKVEYYRQYDANRYRDDPRVRERQKRYQSTGAGKDAMVAARQRWAQKSPEKRAAHTILGNAVRDRRVMKPMCCERCGATGRIHGHHDDYTRPLDVVWVCPACHAAIHRAKIGTQ